MATAASLDGPVLSLLHRSFPDVDVTADADAVKLSSSLYNTYYTDTEKADITQWLITSSHVGSLAEDEAKRAERLSSLNTHLSTRTTVLGAKPSVADVALYARLAAVVSNWSPEERTGEHGHHHIVRFVDFVQNAPILGLAVGSGKKIDIDQDDVRTTIKPIDARADKERKKKEKEAVAAASDSITPTTATDGEAIVAAAAATRNAATKKTKQSKPPKAAPAERPLSPSLIDLRVGHILKAEAHPNADSLYVSTIAVGDAPGTDNTSEYDGQVVRTVCSGLNGLVPLEEMQGRKIVAVCNLKPVTMRGIKSCAMVLAASPKAADGEDSHAGPVELVSPPADCTAGDRVLFDGWDGEPEPVLNPKKKVWETLQPGFTTTDDLEVAFAASDVPQLADRAAGVNTTLARLKTTAGVCTVTSLKHATVR